MIRSLIRNVKRKFKPEPEEILIRRVQPYTLCDESRLRNLIKLCQLVNTNKVDGDFVECGTYRGGSAAVLSKYLDPNRHLWIYDSFKGLPEVSPKDANVAKEYVSRYTGSVKDVKEIMNLLSTGDDCYTIVEGWFNKTFREKIPKRVALLHCDADWYESVTLVLETFYKLVPDGGCVVLDDFGYWEGCREAFYDFCAKYSVKPLLETTAQDQAYWIKGKTHNRNMNLS